VLTHEREGGAWIIRLPTNISKVAFGLIMGFCPVPVIVRRQLARPLRLTPIPTHAMVKSFCLEDAPADLYGKDTTPR